MRAMAWAFHSRVADSVHCSDARPQKKNADALGVFASDLKPSLTLMKALGLLPIKGLQTANPVFRPTSGIFMYSLACYLVMSGLATSVVGYVLIYLRKHQDNYDGSVFNTILLVSLVPSFLLHPLYWFEAKKVVALLKKWVEFQEMFLKTTGTKLNLGLRRLSMIFTMAVPLVVALIVMAELFIFSIPLPSLTVAYTVTVSMLGDHGILWVLQCAAICRSSQLIKDCLKLTLRRKSGAVSLRTLEALWLRLSRLCTATAQALSAAHLLATNICSIVFLMSAYGFLISFDKPDLRLIAGGLGAYALFNVIYLATIYNTGYSVVVTMNDFCDEEIDDLIARDENIRDELHKFMHAVKLNQPSVSFAGVVDVHRKFMSSFASTMLTYIVVLAQFKFGGDTPVPEALTPVGAPTTATEAAPRS
ncbi:gustatory and odorant receptor 24-like isoform X1 [Schistocerca nitens]|uniref:gustatory and odorant receptor 24-like isoform X1 n=1 Tax=Schistocerca nitens TaxID=7011 RepID=UPI002118E64E|nr:gustatory and odorant receptor 24-like isoform X1 [Schistocerca nitens]